MSNVPFVVKNGLVVANNLLIANNGNVNALANLNINGTASFTGNVSISQNLTANYIGSGMSPTYQLDVSNDTRANGVFISTRGDAASNNYNFEILQSNTAAGLKISNTGYFYFNLTPNTANVANTFAAGNFYIQNGYFTLSHGANLTGNVSVDYLSATQTINVGQVQVTTSNVIVGNSYIGFNNINVGTTVYVNSSVFFNGNSTVNTFINSSSISLNGLIINSAGYSGTANNSTYFNGNPTTYFANVTNPSFSTQISIANGGITTSSVPTGSNGLIIQFNYNSQNEIDYISQNQNLGSLSGHCFFIKNSNTTMLQVGSITGNGAIFNYGLKTSGQLYSNGSASLVGVYDRTGDTNGNFGFYRTSNINYFYDSTFGNVFSVNSIGVITTYGNLNISNGTLNVSGNTSIGGYVTGLAPSANDNSNTLVTSSWVNNYVSSHASSGFSTGNIGGFINKIRNGTMDIWQRGSNTLVVNTAGSYTADGWFVIPTGNSCGVQANSGRLYTINSLQINGNTNISDIKLIQPIESYLSVTLSGQVCTFQAQLFNGTGSTITPTFTVKHPNAQDNYSSNTIDINGVSLQSCVNNAWTQLGYTWTAFSNSNYGMEIIIDLGNNFSLNSKYIKITEIDVRATPNTTTGLNSNVQPVELRFITTEQELCERYYEVPTTLANTSNFSQGYVTRYAMAYTFPCSTAIYGPFYSYEYVWQFNTPKRTIPTLLGNYKINGSANVYISTYNICFYDPGYWDQGYGGQCQAPGNFMYVANTVATAEIVP